MRRALLIFLTVLTIALATQAQASKDQKLSKTEQEILKLNQLWADSIVRGDVAALDRLFADDMVITAGNGTVRDKAGEIDDLRPSTDIKTYFFNTDDVRVRVYKDAAVVTGRAKWRINLKGRDIDNERRYTHVYVRQRGSWRIVAQHISRIAQPPK